MTVTVGIPDPEIVKTYYNRSPYREFLATEGIPIYDEYSVDCNTVAVEPWERLGGLGAYVHLTGRSDFLNAYIHEIPPGGQTNVEQHMFDKLMYVTSGRGATSVVNVPQPWITTRGSGSCRRMSSERRQAGMGPAPARPRSQMARTRPGLPPKAL